MTWIDYVYRFVESFILIASGIAVLFVMYKKRSRAVSEYESSPRSFQTSKFIYALGILLIVFGSLLLFRTVTHLF